MCAQYVTATSPYIPPIWRTGCGSADEGFKDDTGSYRTALSGEKSTYDNGIRAKPLRFSSCMVNGKINCFRGSSFESFFFIQERTVEPSLPYKY